VRSVRFETAHPERPLKLRRAPGQRGRSGGTPAGWGPL